MKKYLIALLLVCSLPAWSDAFSQRVSDANKVAKTPAGKKYDDGLIPYIKSTLKTCDPKTKLALTKGHLTLVSNISPDGVLQNIEIRPKKGKLEECFRANFGMPSLPVPPTNGKKGKGHPIVISITNN